MDHRVAVWVVTFITMGCSRERAEPAPTPAGQAAKQTATAAAPGARSDGLGSGHFATAGGPPAARPECDRGVPVLPAFWYDGACRRFDAASAAGPTFAMAYWGRAMSACKILWGDDDLEGGRAALARMPGKDRLVPREAAWVAAATALLGE